MSPPLRRLTWVSLAAALALGATACGGDDDDATGGGDHPRIYVAASARPPADRGRDVIDAARLAVREAEGRAGLYNVELVVRDEGERDRRWTPDRVATIAREALQDETVVAYVGALDAGAAAVAVPILNSGGVTLVDPAVGYTGLTGTAGAGKGEPERFYPTGRRTFVRLVGPDDVQAEVQAAAQRDAGCRRLAVVDQGDAFTDSTARLVARAAEQQGIAISAEERAPRDAEGDVAFARDLARGRPDCVFLGFGDAARAAQAARTLAGTLAGARLFAPATLDTTAFTAALGPAARRTRVSVPLPNAGAQPAARRFAGAFAATYGRPPGPWASRSYEAVKAVLAAIAAAGDQGNERSAVTEQLMGADRQETVVGDYAVQSSGDTTLRRYEVVPAGSRLASSG